MNVAASVRLNKEKYPHLYCGNSRCLWRVQTIRGPNPCPRHQAAPANELQGLLEQSVAATERLESLLVKQEDAYYDGGIKAAETFAGDIAEAREALAEITP